MVLRCAVRESLSWFGKRDRDIKLKAEQDLLRVVQQNVMQHKQNAEKQAEKSRLQAAIHAGPFHSGQ